MDPINITMLGDIKEIQTIKTVLEVLIILIALSSLGSIWLQSFVFYKNRLLFKCVVSHFVLNLITVDFFKTLINVPIFIVSLEVILGKQVTDRNKDVLCNLNTFFVAFFDTVQLFSFAAISFERLRCIRTPMLAIQVRVKFTLKLILAAWLAALISVIALFVIITIITNFENVYLTNNKCFLDYYHLYALNTTATDLKYNQYQNIIFDAYNVLVTSIGLMIAVFFYSKISFFLENRRLEMETKYRDIRSDRLEGQSTTIIASESSEVVEKRKRETKTTKNTIVILSTFITFRVIFLFVIIFRQLLNYGHSSDATISVFYIIELFLIVISYLSCFFNAFIFLYLTDMCRTTATAYIDKALVKLRLKSN